MHNFIDTHCHIHFPEYPLNTEETLKNAVSAGVKQLICVGCTLQDSLAGAQFAQKHTEVYASIGIHPHEAQRYIDNEPELQQFRNLLQYKRIVAIGETGLDYFYDHSKAHDQEKILRFQLDLAIEHNLPLIFHVRQAFKDFWQIFDEYQGLRGVIHSFSASSKELDEILSRGLYVGLNGIMTFTKDESQLEAAKLVPLDRLLLETDAPFLTPKPFRGRICEPRHVIDTAKFLAEIRGDNLGALALATTQNSKKLFNI